MASVEPYFPHQGKKVRITIRLDRDIIDWFRSKVEEQGRVVTISLCLMHALRAYMERQAATP